MLPGRVVGQATALLDSVAAGLVALGVTANAITLASLGLAAVAAVLLAEGQLGWAAPAIGAASLGDALDGLVARRTGTASTGGALLDASVDRYEEALLLGGLAVLLRGSIPALLLTLAALTASFMVSYGSAKAEGLGRPVPPGVMRRAERAMLLFAGVAATPPFASFVRSHAPDALDTWQHLPERTPLLAALAIIAVVGNVSAALRLRRLSAG
jgi:CDP-diacylglycerol--glycerol-3-phosphate 3-phosphatidyltransferase